MWTVRSWSFPKTKRPIFSSSIDCVQPSWHRARVKSVRSLFVTLDYSSITEWNCGIFEKLFALDRWVIERAWMLLHKIWSRTWRIYFKLDELPKSWEEKKKLCFRNLSKCDKNIVELVRILTKLTSSCEIFFCWNFRNRSDCTHPTRDLSKVCSHQKECLASWSLQPIQTWRNLVFQPTSNTAVTFDSFKRCCCQFCFEGSLMCSPRLLLRLRHLEINFLYVIDNSFLCRCFSSTRTRKKV